MRLMLQTETIEVSDEEVKKKRLERAREEEVDQGERKVG